MHAYEFSITAKTATTAVRTLKKMQERTVLRGNRQSTQKCTNERKSYTAPASQAYSAAPCRVAIVHHRFLACTLSIRQRLPRKTRNVPPAIPYVFLHSLAPLFLLPLAGTEPVQYAIQSIRVLVRYCESVNKSLYESTVSYGAVRIRYCFRFT